MKIYRVTTEYHSGTVTHSYSDSARAWQLGKDAYRWGNPKIFKRITLSVLDIPEEFVVIDQMEITGD